MEYLLQRCPVEDNSKISRAATPQLGKKLCCGLSSREGGSFAGPAQEALQEARAETGKGAQGALHVRFLTCNTCFTLHVKHVKNFGLHVKTEILDKFHQISSFSKKFGEIPTKFHQNLASKWQNSIEKYRIELFIFHFRKKFHDFQPKF